MSAKDKRGGADSELVFIFGIQNRCNLNQSTLMLLFFAVKLPLSIFSCFYKFM